MKRYFDHKQLLYCNIIYQLNRKDYKINKELQWTMDINKYVGHIIKFLVLLGLVDFLLCLKN